MKKRKLLTAMLALWFGLPSFAEVYEGTCGENVRYSLDTETGVLALTGEGIIFLFHHLQRSPLECPQEAY